MTFISKENDHENLDYLPTPAQLASYCYSQSSTTFLKARSETLDFMLKILTQSCADQEHRRRDLHKDPEMAKYRDLITWADHLIFIFPIWWSMLPAILKGFIDRVFGLTLPTLIKSDSRPPARKSGWIIVSHNTPGFALPFVQDYGKVLKNQILKLCGISPVKLTELNG